MKKTFYMHCPLCHKRMRLFSKEADNTARYYFCSCGELMTYFRDLNAVSNEWPETILELAVRQGIVAPIA